MTKPPKWLKRLHENKYRALYHEWAMNDFESISAEHDDAMRAAIKQMKRDNRQPRTKRISGIPQVR